MVEAVRNVLITGGLGYVGGRIATHLTSSVPELCLRLMTHRDAAAVPRWAMPLDIVSADVRDEQSLLSALEGIDTVIHLAAVNEIEAQRDPELALEVNGKGTYNLLRACHSIGITRFIYFSTFHVYGPGAAQPITESTPTRPVHPYAFTHRLAEDLVNWYRHSCGMQVLILRLSNGYGYPADAGVDRWTLVFNDLCMQAVKNRAITLRSSGTQQRDFVSLANIARGVHHFLDSPSETWGDGLFNFGGAHSMSILEVAELIAAEYQRSYDREIAISVGDAEDAQVTGPVVFDVQKLRQTGFCLEENMSEEVQGTFRLCEELVRQGGQAG